jgi:hypothetical protein
VPAGRRGERGNSSRAPPGCEETPDMFGVAVCGRRPLQLAK